MLNTAYNISVAGLSSVGPGPGAVEDQGCSNSYPRLVSAATTRIISPIPPRVHQVMVL